MTLSVCVDCASNDIRFHLFDDEPAFSWLPCIGCGSRLGGDRYTVTEADYIPLIMARITKPIEVTLP